jgi:hypothetical protein
VVQRLLHRRMNAKQQMRFVSRVAPVQTALRNCMRDEGGPFELGNQVLISNHRKLLWSKSHGGERCGKVGNWIPAGMIERGERKRTADEVSKAVGDVKTEATSSSGMSLGDT